MIPSGKSKNKAEKWGVSELLVSIRNAYNGFLHMITMNHIFVYKYLKS